MRKQNDFVISIIYHLNRQTILHFYSILLQFQNSCQSIGCGFTEKYRLFSASQ